MWGVARKKSLTGQSIEYQTVAQVPIFCTGLTKPAKVLARVNLFFRFHCFILLSFLPHEHVNSQLGRISQNCFQYQRWTIAKTSLTRDVGHDHGWGFLECHDLRWLSLESQKGTFRFNFQAPSVSPQLQGNVTLEISQLSVEKNFN